MACAEILERARLFPQSVPYAAIVCLTRAALGSSEAALRLPSLLAMAAAAHFAYRLGRDLFDRETGWITAGVFLLSPQVEFAAADARPYAFAVLASTLALWFLHRALARGRAADAFGYVLSAGAMVYFQYLFAACLAPHAVYALLRLRRGCPVSRPAILSWAAALGLLLWPAAVLAREIGVQRDVHAFGTLPGFGQLLLSMAPIRTLGLVVPALILCRIAGLAGAFRFERPAGSRLDAVALLALAALLPPIVLFVASRVGATPVFEGRYLMGTVTPWAAGIAWLLGMVQPASGRRGALAVALATALVVRGELGHRAIGHSREDWRGAVSALDSRAAGVPVLLAGSFTESRDLARVRDPAHRSYLAAPLTYYRPAGPVYVLPLRTGSAAESFAEGLVIEASRQGTFAILERGSRSPSWVPWLQARTRPMGYSDREIFRSPALIVRLFTRTAAGRGEGLSEEGRRAAWPMSLEKTGAHESRGSTVIPSEVISEPSR